MQTPNDGCINIALPTWLIHDLLQPINAVALLGVQIEEAIERKSERDDELSVAWSLISRAILNHEKQLQNLRLYWQLQLNKINTNRKATPICNLLGELVNNYQARNPKLAIKLEVSGSDIVESNPDCLQIIIGSILDNAVRYAKSLVVISIIKKSNHIHLEISDDGPGFSDDSLNNIGSPFYRDRSAVKKNGLGLGLFISIELARKMGHSILFPPLTGARNMVSILMQASIVKEFNGSNNYDSLCESRILLIDNNTNVDQILCHLLESWGCSVTHIKAEADARANKFEFNYSIVIIGRSMLAYLDASFVSANFLSGKKKPRLFVLVEAGDAIPHGEYDEINILWWPSAPSRLRRLFENAINGK